MSRRRYKVHPKLSPEQQKLVADHAWIPGRLAHGALCLTGGNTGCFTKEDLESVAFFALCVAASRYNPDMKLKYSTYAWATARGYIQHALRDFSRMVKTPRWVVLYKTRVNDLLKMGKSYAEIAEELGIDENAVMICDLSAQNYHISYDSSPEDWVTPEFVFEFEEHKATLLSPELISAIKTLTDAEIHMILKFVEGTCESEEEREWAAERFFELQGIAHGTQEAHPN